MLTDTFRQVGEYKALRTQPQITVNGDMEAGSRGICASSRRSKGCGIHATDSRAGRWHMAEWPSRCTGAQAVRRSVKQSIAPSLSGFRDGKRLSRKVLWGRVVTEAT